VALAAVEAAFEANGALSVTVTSGAHILQLGELLQRLVMPFLCVSDGGFPTDGWSYFSIVAVCCSCCSWCSYCILEVVTATPVALYGAIHAVGVGIPV
jgi:hypothetical protein